jgi:hypothetical protein
VTGAAPFQIVATDHEGRFVLDRLDGTPHDIRARSITSQQVLLRGVDPATARPLRIVHRAGGTLEGRLIDDEGSPIESALIAATSASAGDAGGDVRHATTDHDGRFRVVGLESAPYRQTSPDPRVSAALFTDAIAPGDTRGGIHFEPPPAE